MSGGVCEASAFAQYGYRTTGIAFPLGNYHNSSPNGGVEAEYIEINDFLGGIQLMKEAAYRAGELDNVASTWRLSNVSCDQRQRLISTSVSSNTYIY